jgi:hypothetical protein
MFALAVSMMLMAAGGDLDAAKQAYGDVEYGRCRDKAQGALNEPGTRAERVDAYRLLGLCSAAHGDTDDARDAFRHMLMIDLEARLPPGLSPRFTSSFREAKGSLVGTTPLALTIERNDVVGATRTIRVRVADSEDLVAQLATREKNGGLSTPVKKAVEVEFEVAAGVDVEVVGLDGGGGEVVGVTVSGVGAEAKDVVAASDAADDGEGDGTVTAIVIGGIAGAVLLVGGAAAVLGVLLAPPQTVTLKTEVAFADR